MYDIDKAIQILKNFRELEEAVNKLIELSKNMGGSFSEGKNNPSPVDNLGRGKKHLWVQTGGESLYKCGNCGESYLTCYLKDCPGARPTEEKLRENGLREGDFNIMFTDETMKDITKLFEQYVKSHVGEWKSVPVVDDKFPPPDPKCGHDWRPKSDGKGFWCGKCGGEIVCKRLKEHEWAVSTNKPLCQCINCGGFYGICNHTDCPDTKPFEGKTEPCCDCGEDYPAVDLVRGEIYCPRCRAKPAGPCQEVPKATDHQVWHGQATVGNAYCASVKSNEGMTTVPGRVNCPDCLRVIRSVGKMIEPTYSEPSLDRAYQAWQEENYRKADEVAKREILLRGTIESFPQKTSGAGVHEIEEVKYIISQIDFGQVVDLTQVRYLLNNYCQMLYKASQGKHAPTVERNEG